MSAKKLDLSPDERMPALVLAVAAVGISRSNLLQCVKEAGATRENGRAYNLAALGSILDALAARGQISFHGYAAASTELTWALLLSEPRGALDPILACLRRLLPYDDKHAAQAQRELHMALLDHDAAAVERWLTDGNLNRFRGLDERVAALPPLALRHLQANAPIHALALMCRLRVARRALAPADALVRELDTLGAASTLPAAAAHELARHHLLGNRPDVARRLLAAHPDDALGLWLAVVAGEPDRARALAPIAGGGRLSGPEMVMGAVVRIAARGDGVVGMPPIDSGELVSACAPTLNAIERCLRSGARDPDFAPWSGWSLSTHEAEAWIGVCLRVLEQISGEALPAYAVPSFPRILAKATAAGQHWLLAALEPAAATPAKGSLAAAFVVSAPWERKLTRLEKTVEKIAAERAPVVPKSTPIESKSTTTRVVWVVDRANPSEIGPREQRADARGGWSKGRRIALERLFGARPDYQPLTAADRAVCAFIRENVSVVRGYTNISYHLDSGDAFAALAAHPFVFWDGDDARTRLTLRDAEPSLHIVAAGAEFALRVEPRLHFSGAMLSQTGDYELSRVRASDAQVELSHALGDGVRVPTSEAARIERLVARVTGLIAIRSDVGTTPVEAALLGGQSHYGEVDEVACDTRPVFQLAPSGDVLRLRVRMRPLGADGPALVPGEGAATVTALRGMRTILARRDFAAELAQVDAVLGACAALFLGEVAADGEWQMPDAATSLELVSQLGALGDALVLEWPAGQRMEVVGAADASALRLTIGAGAGGWFELSGELTVDAARVVELGELLHLVADSPHRFVALSPGRFLALGERLREQLATLARVASAKRGARATLHPWAAAALESLADEAGHVKAVAAWKKVDAARREAARFEAPVPKTLKASLRDYQRDGFRWLARLARLGAGACLADDMGLGKTLQCLALLVTRAPDGAQLVVCPSSVIGGWLDEAARFAPTLHMTVFGGGDRAAALDKAGPFDVVVASYGLLQSEAEALAARAWTTVVLDEAQAIKNPDTLRAKAAYALQTSFRVALTGTPVENRLEDLWSLFHFAVPGLLGTRAQFRERFVGPPGASNEPADLRARAALKQIVRPLLLRRTKSEVLDELPERTEMVMHVDLGPEEAALYEALRLRALTSLAAHAAEPSGQRRVRVLAEIMRLRRACCHPRLVAPDAPELIATGGSAKLAALVELVSELRDGGHRALIYSQFVDHLQVVREHLDAQAIAYQYLDGGTPQRQRQDAVRAFQAGEGEVFLISLRAGGTGLNLTGADFVIHLDPWWNPAVEDQASDRVYRIGQERPVTIVRLIARATIEERILALHRVKRELADDLLEGTGEAAKLDADALIALLGAA